MPFFLSRWLSSELFGAYRQLIMLKFLAQALSHGGMNIGLFFFARRDANRAENYSLNAMLIGLGFALMAGMESAFSVAIGNRTVKAAPAPGSDVTEMAPPWA